MSRPIYLGMGECACGKPDTKLYHVPGTELAHQAVCARCLEARGFAMPVPRTADDLETGDGRPERRAETVTKPYPKEPEPYVGKLDLGYGHYFEVVIGNDERLVGWLHTHPDARGGAALCQSFCTVRPLNGAPVHQILCADPLTLTPSLLCRTCGAHGNVVNGKWEPI